MNIGSRAVGELTRVRSVAEQDGNLGSGASQEAARWLRNNSQPEELAATNFLTDYQTGGPLSDFSLGSWSQREFLVLGPNLFSSKFDDVRALYELSMFFGESADVGSAEVLRGVGVGWFVVDLWSTSFRDWGSVADVVYENDRFLIVKL